MGNARDYARKSEIGKWFHGFLLPVRRMRGARGSGLAFLGL